MSNFNNGPRIPLWVWSWIFIIACVAGYYLFPPFARLLDIILDRKHHAYVFLIAFFLSCLEYLFFRDSRKTGRYDDVRRNSNKNTKRNRKKNAKRNRKRGFDQSLLVILASLLGAIGFVFIAVLSYIAIYNTNKLSKNSTPKSSSRTSSKPVTKPRPKPRYDAAVDVKGQVRFYADSRFPNLTTGDYKKAAGDLARIQFKILKNRSQAKNYPTVLIGNGSWQKEVCNEALPTLGLYQYGYDCNRLITINFEAGNLYYEHQIEVLVTLAHEWGHHLIELSGENISGINNELLADCFAGVYLAYLDKYGAVTKKELRDTVKMMSQIGNTHGTGIHGTPAQRVNGLLSGVTFYADRSDSQNQANWDNYCKGLEDVIDVRKPLP